MWTNHQSKCKEKKCFTRFQGKRFSQQLFLYFFLHENYINTEENYVNADRGKYNDFAGFMENINLFKKWVKICNKLDATQHQLHK